GLDVAIEDADVRGERDDAFLDARAGAVAEADDRGAGLEGEVHQLVDLLGEHLAERTTEDGEVLAEHEHLAAVAGAPPGDPTGGVGALFETGLVGAVAGEHVELVEAAIVEEVLDPLAGEYLALGMLTLDRSFGPCVAALFAARPQVLELLVNRRHGSRR